MDIFQAHNPIPILTALENVGAVLTLSGVPYREAIRRVADLLGQLGLA
jgi:predicted ABC-type transport system involved in lysophospholipase L1 biosynthesis ATPase subunit